jgi:hypothetical protein
MPPKSSRITSDEKPVVSFRMSFRLTAWLKDAASKRSWSMNEYVVSALEGLQRMWGFPVMMAEVLEADRKAMGLDEFDYVGHLLARRYNEIRDQGGPGFEKSKRKTREG